MIHMATWNDYKRRVRESNPDITKDIDEIEKRSQAYSRDEIPNTETVAALSEYHEMKSKRLTKQRTCQTRSPSERIIPCNGRVILRAVSKIHGHSEKIH